MSVFRNLEQQIRQFCEHTDGCGVAVAIVNHGEIVYAQAFGPLPLEMPLAVASLSKPIFAYAVLQLCEQRVLDLDRPLAEYLPQPYLAGDPFVPLITTRQVLNHTTGFPNWRNAEGLRVAFPPGSAFHYSTEGLLYLQTVVEHLTQQPLQEYMRQHIFEPFDMKQSQFVPEDLSLVQSFLPAGSRAYGGISLQTTATDYARFLMQMMQMGDGSMFHLSPAMCDEMLRPHIRVGDQRDLSWGLGWGIQHETGQADSFWHWGAKRELTRNFVMGYRTRQTGVVIFTTHLMGLHVCEEIAQTVWQHPSALPAFRWLLPAEQWQADGLASLANSAHS